MAQPKYSLEEYGSFKDKLYPIIKVHFTDGPHDDMVDIIFTEEDEPIHTEIAGDLFVYYGIDRGENFELLKRNDIPKSITDSTLLATSIANLDNILDGKIRISNTTFKTKMIICGYNWEASTILLDWIWDEQIDTLGDNLVVAIPSKDLLFFTLQSDKSGIESMKKEISNVHSDGEYLLSKKLFLVTKKSIVEYKE
ncbi:MAG: DUF1444 family protein [Bacteroidetes bacterium]|nr:DUF1444 family protein [Bacteroidota bacterium]